MIGVLILLKQRVPKRTVSQTDSLTDRQLDRQTKNQPDQSVLSFLHHGKLLLTTHNITNASSPETAKCFVRKVTSANLVISTCTTYWKRNWHIDYILHILSCQIYILNAEKEEDEEPEYSNKKKLRRREHQLTNKQTQHAFK